MYELKLAGAVLMSHGKQTTPALLKDTFGPGMDGTNLSGGKDRPDELRYACSGLPEGDYCVGLPVLSPNRSYFGVGEEVSYQLEIHHNDDRQAWTGYTQPLRPKMPPRRSPTSPNCDWTTPYTSSPPMSSAWSGGAIPRWWWGRCASITTSPPARSRHAPPYNGTRSRFLYADWGDADRSPQSITQSCTLTNPGVLPHTYQVTVQARDYFMAPLMARQTESLVLQPGQSVTRTYQFTPSATGQDRLILVAQSEGMFPTLRTAKFYVRDRAWGERPNTCLSGPGWEFCYAGGGVEPGSVPPADATWTPISVPSVQSNKEIKKHAGPGGADVQVDHHCAWYRRRFSAPPNIHGERIILKCDSVMSEAWFYLNGKAVGHERHGAQPFEVDITDGCFRPGEPNELLIAVRDWLAYSPKNLDRARRGEPLIVRQDLEDLATYASTDVIGILKPIYLEARPAISIDDVFIVPSVRKNTLTLKYRLVNKSPQTQEASLSPRVLDEGQSLTPKACPAPPAAAGCFPQSA